MGLSAGALWTTPSARESNVENKEREIGYPWVASQIIQALFRHPLPRNDSNRPGFTLSTHAPMPGPAQLKCFLRGPSSPRPAEYLIGMQVTMCIRPAAVPVAQPEACGARSAQNRSRTPTPVLRAIGRTSGSTGLLRIGSHCSVLTSAPMATPIARCTNRRHRSSCYPRSRQARPEENRFLLRSCRRAPPLARRCGGALRISRGDGGLPGRTRTRHPDCL